MPTRVPVNCEYWVNGSHYYYYHKEGYCLDSSLFPGQPRDV